MVGTRPTRPAREPRRSVSSVAGVRECRGGHRRSRTGFLAAAASSSRRILAARIGRTRPSVTARSRVARGQRDVGRQRLRRVGLEVGEVRPHGVDVASHDRAGQGGVALLERVVEGGGEQRAQRAGRVADTRGREDLHRLGDQGDQVVGPVRQTGVVERAASARAPRWPSRRGRRRGARRSRARPGRRSGRRPVPGRRSRSTSVPVNVMAGWIARTRAPTRRAGSRTARPCRPEVCATYWPARMAPLAASMETTLSSMSSGTVRSSRSPARADVGRLQRGDAGQQRGDPGPGGVGLTGGGDDVVAGGAQSGGKDGADASRTDNPHLQVSHQEPFRSRPSDHLALVGQAGVGTGLLVSSTPTVRRCSAPVTTSAW